MNQMESNLSNTIVAPQRLIADSMTNPWVQWYRKHHASTVIPGENGRPLVCVTDRGAERHLSPEEILAMLLVHMRGIAEDFLNMPVSQAVVTVPARYGRLQREAIVAACRSARLNVVELLKAPTASAVAYLLTNRKSTHRNVLVCNLGATFFDFALLGVRDAAIYERSVGTDVVDLDNCLVRFCVRDCMEKFSIDLSSQPVAMQRLRRACEMAKQRLSQYNQARIEMSSSGEVSSDYACNISRVHFEDLCKDDIRNILDPLAYCLEEVGMDKDDVHEVVLVGGSARVPLLRRAVRDFFHGKVPREVLRPNHAAVLGAAAYAASLADKADSGDDSDEGSLFGTASKVPEELKHLSLKQVTTFSTVPLQREDEWDDDASVPEEELPMPFFECTKSSRSVSRATNPLESSTCTTPQGAQIHSLGYSEADLGLPAGGIPGYPQETLPAGSQFTPGEILRTELPHARSAWGARVSPQYNTGY
eukprot:TRINITY_DN1269_c2_g2_i1.p1 TRINITY_DN1269_c2_g2~~TRINITY_DN1269_c2_g2_i1.p1  ORF type:complete len:528 (-),score=122.32 TRINITY_DN1269_c2_g2_i1:154-1584(-)